MEINPPAPLRINGEQIRTIKNLEKAAGRILQAIKKGENILLYGDADLDGVNSVIILKEAIQNLGGLIPAIYFPDRENEGYGISKEGLGYLKKFSPALLITLDCGIGNFKEIKLARKYGFEVIVIDHHEILDKLPQAQIIVDPKQKGDRYAFKELATVGIAFKLSEMLLKAKMTTGIKRSLLELVAIATLADMMPRINENKIFIEEGLSSLDYSWRPGINSFFKTDFLRGYNIIQRVSKIISILNVRDVENHLPASFRVLTSVSSEKTQELIKKLIEKSKFRKEKIEDICDEIAKRIQKRNEAIIFEGDENWDFSLISPVASISSQKYKKPAFIFKKLKTESQGTVRVPPRIDSVELMKKCKKLLITYGGHPRASGFRIKNENLEKFRTCLIENLYHGV